MGDAGDIMRLGGAGKNEEAGGIRASLSSSTTNNVLEDEAASSFGCC
jgi:hypothetical protein